MQVNRSMAYSVTGHRQVHGTLGTRFSPEWFMNGRTCKMFQELPAECVLDTGDVRMIVMGQCYGCALQPRPLDFAGAKSFADLDMRLLQMVCPESAHRKSFHPCGIASVCVQFTKAGKLALQLESECTNCGMHGAMLPVASGLPSQVCQLLTAACCCNEPRIRIFSLTGKFSASRGKDAVAVEQTVEEGKCGICFEGTGLKGFRCSVCSMAYHEECFRTWLNKE